MPLRSISGKEAIENLKNNLYGTWPAREPADTNRIEPYCQPEFSPTFHLEPGEMIFTIGSCFARNIERGLVRRGFDVATTKLHVPDTTLDRNGPGLLNNYGVVSIENEFRWALDPDNRFDPAVHILEVAPGKYVDPHLSVRPAALDRMLAYRSAVIEVTRLVRDCRVVIMTLGLSEVWFDTQTQTYLNRTPLRSLVARHEGRFELHLLDFHDTMQSLSNVITLLRRHCRADQRVLLTVSPVPLGDTHTGQDVIVVNSYSKAVLRTAAEHIATAHDHVDYFPSYESVVLSERAHAWMDDQAHVTGPLIDLNVERMLRAYVQDGEDAPVDVRLVLRNAANEIDAENPHAARALLQPLRDVPEMSPEHALIYAELCLSAGLRDAAWDARAKLPSSAEIWRAKIIEARVLIHDGKVDEGVELLSGLAASRPRAVPIVRALTEVCFQLGRWDDALLAALRWSNLVKNAAAPHHFAARVHMAMGDVGATENAFRAMRDAKGVRDRSLLDYVDFLVGQKRFPDAARELAFVVPENPATLRRIEQIKSFLPTIGAS